MFGIENSRNSAIWDTPGVKALSKFKGVNAVLPQRCMFPEHPISLIILLFKCHCTVFCTDVQILQCLASQAAQFLRFQLF